MKLKTAPMDMIIRTVYEHNILPITSQCNARCLFCSHKGNPSDVLVYKLPYLSLDDYRELISFLNPDTKIIIGDSATRIIEGEPFLHSDIFDILALIRKSYPSSLIQITTNGSLLEERSIQSLEVLKPLELNVSVNSINFRQHLMRIYRDNCVKALKLLSKTGIPFNASIVAVKTNNSWQDLQETIQYLDECNVQLIRVFVPGWSRLIKPDAEFFQLYKEIFLEVEEIAKRTRVPVVVEPPVIEELHAQVEGVLKGSPAERCGIKKGDVVLKINGEKMRTRVEAFEKLKKSGECELEIQRSGKRLIKQLKKDPGQHSGMVFLYDIHPQVLDDVTAVVERENPRSAALITSLLGEPILKKLLEQRELPVEIAAVPSRFFGGSICCCGLLTVGDIAQELITRGAKWDLLILPSTPFDKRGEDLTGTSYRELEGLSGSRVAVL